MLIDKVYSSACCGRWIPQDTVDFDKVKNWLWLCDSFHDEQCRPQIQPANTSLGWPRGFIDVQRGRVVGAPTRSKYICLSYVWGGAEQLVLDYQMPVLLSKDGGIYETFTDQDVHETRISRTVEDAIRTIQMLGEQYLWVDAGCIKQDDVSSAKMEEINAMDVIYSQAPLTIVAAAGDGANTELAGLRSGSRDVLQHMEVVKNRSLITTVSPTYDFDVSVWERRGWTLQERALSRRLFVFTANQVYLSWRRTHFLEDTVSEMAPRDVRIRDFPNIGRDFVDGFYVADDEKGHFEFYRQLVRQYTMRKISYAEDALNACRGLLSDCQKPKSVEDSRFAYGLPLSEFTAALCWTAFPHSPESRREDFPQPVIGVGAL